MKTIKTILPLLSFMILIITSCEKTVTNVDLPEVKPKLVVQSFISPQDDKVIIDLSLSRPVFGENNSSGYDAQPINNATIVISDGTISKTVNYDSKDKQYIIQTSDFPIVAGKTYTLNVSTSDGKSCNATCTVPINSITDFEVLLIDTSDSYENDNILKTRFKDIQGENNYYRVFAYIKESYIQNDTIYYQLDNEYDDELVKEYDKDGEWINQKFEFYNNGIISFIFDILNVDEHYYNYHKSVFNS